VSFGVSLVLVLLLALLVPTNMSAHFNGLPFTTTGELFGIAGLTFALSIGVVRKHLIQSAERFRRPTRGAILSLLFLTILLKVLVFFVQPTAGQFEVCYRHFNARAGVDCVPTFEPHPAFAVVGEQFSQRSTNMRTIHFGPRKAGHQGLSTSSWRLPFVNSDDFDKGFWPWVKAQKNIETFPFWAEFRGVVDTQAGDEIQIAYLGQGRIEIDGRNHHLRPSYKEASIFVSPPVSKNAQVVVDYAYLETRGNSEEAVPPYALLRVEKLSENRLQPLLPATPRSLSLLNGVTDLVTICFFVLVMWMLRRTLLHVIASSLFAIVFWQTLDRDMTVGIGLAKLEMAIVLLLLGLFTMRKSEKLTSLLILPFVATGFGMTRQEVTFATGLSPQLGDVLVRLRGNDHLVYESLTREMLATGVLRGGEDVYYFQPGIRYWYYISHLLFGESGVVIGGLSVVLIGLGILFIARQLAWDGSRLARLGNSVALGSLVIWWSSSHTVQSAVFGLSEFGTWILLLFAFGLLLQESAVHKLWMIGLFMGLIVWIRPNQGMGMVMMFVLVIVLYVRRGESWKKTSIQLAMPFMCLMVLLPIHNLVYGRVFQLLPGGHTSVRQAGWDSFVKAFTDQDSRSFLLSQLRGLLYLPSVQPETYSTRLAVALLGFGVVALTALALGIKNWSQQGLLVTSALLVVLAQVFPFLNYTIFRYFPIHNIAIYLTTVLVSILIISQSPPHKLDQGIRPSHSDLSLRLSANRYRSMSR